MTATTMTTWDLTSMTTTRETVTVTPDTDHDNRKHRVYSHHTEE